MNIEKAVLILKQHNKWRRGADIPMANPTELGIAIDTVITYTERRLKDDNRIKPETAGRKE